MLEIRGLKKVYNPGTVTEMTLFDGFDLSVPDGQFVSIVGSNGSGKTSLLNIICGSIPMDGGDVVVDGKSLRKLKDFQRYGTIGRVYQNPSLGTAPNLTMLENLSLADNKGKGFGLTRGINRKRQDFYRQELSGLGLGLEDKLDVKMGALSGGQRQAVALLMATLKKPKLLLLDEHTAALDPKTAAKVLDATERIVGKDRLTTLMITHNMKDAIVHGNRLIMMYEGRIALDIKGEDKKKLTVEQLLAKFGQATGSDEADDKLLLG